MEIPVTDTLGTVDTELLDTDPWAWVEQALSVTACSYGTAKWVCATANLTTAEVTSCCHLPQANRFIALNLKEQLPLKFDFYDEPDFRARFLF